MYKAEYTDFAYLKGDGNLDGLRRAIAIAKRHKPRGLCVNPVVAEYARRFDDISSALLADHGFLRQFVIDFPLGQGGVMTKYKQASGLLQPFLLADEFDVVANVGALLSDDFQTFSDEILAVIGLGKPVKVIVETGYYPDDDGVLERALEWCHRVGTFAIKTSTGFLQGIDNETKRRHVSFWRKLIDERGYKIQIKDAGGKKTREDIDASLEAGADILGIGSLIE